jgi:TrpR-related protein YerC/YecD
MTNDKNNNAPENLQTRHETILREDVQQALQRALLCLRDGEEVRKFLVDLCTPKELRDLAERLLIARLLDEGGMSYREISAATGASTTTVGRVARFLQQEPHQGYRLVLDRMEGVSDDLGGDTGTGQ